MAWLNFGRRHTDIVWTDNYTIMPGSIQITGTWPLVERDMRWLPYREWKRRVRGNK